ncbi:MAG: excinuclease ABC subunit C [Paludibacteraceae bacterium]|nr:excinuclease ABC subunit C [Paludibacteraceae bacterium]
MKPSAHIEGIIKNLPESPGVYQYLNSDGVIIYVGKAKNLKRRVNSYFNKEHESYKTRMLVKNIADMRYIVVNSEQDAFLLENNLIKQYQPHYNILLKDGKSYPSICITKEPYPRIFKTRTIDKTSAEYYGPYSFGNTVDLVLETIHNLYPLRTCHQHITEQLAESGKLKVCLKYHLKKCCGVCENIVTREEYLKYVDAARKIIRGDAQELQKEMLSEMQQLAADMRFEEAQQIKEKYLLIEKFRSKTVISNTTVRDVDVFGYEENGQNVYISMLRLHNGSIVQGQTIEYRKQLDEDKEDVLAHGIVEIWSQLDRPNNDVIVPFIPTFHDDNVHFSTPQSGNRSELLKLAMQNVRQYKHDRIKQSDKLNPDQRAMRILTTLQQMAGLSELPMWIDSFDNSNLQGTDAVAGCVVFKKAKPSKTDYRKFIIKTVEGADDYASMREVVYRRYSRLLEEGSDMPNLIIADGGIGQMHAIREAVEDGLGLHIPIAGLVKDDRHRTSTLLVGFPPKEVGMKPTDEVFMFLTRIQDEVHRYAISFHKQRRSKRRTESELDEIAGVGEKTKKELLLAFHSIKRLKEAKLEDIQLVAGTKRGSDIYNYFHGKISS